VLQDNGVEVVETTGAGDSSAGAIIAALAAGTDLATAAAFGISTARIVLSDWGHRALAHADPLTRPLDRIRVTRQSRRRPRRQTAGSTMSTARANLDALIGALSEIGPTGPAPATTIGNALFVGSGDSLAACLLAQAAGQHAASAGDVAWTGGIPPRIDTVVGVSHSGRTAATVEALNIANQAGLPTIAITVHTDSALARIADRVVTATDIGVSETIPAAGYLSLALAVLATLGVEATGGFAGIGDTMKTLTPAATGLAAALPPAMPAAISVLSLPDLRSAGDFWSLKLIEATGLPVRSLALEEAGHVDYFIGPQSHLTLQLIGQYGHARHSRLAQALAGNGHTVLSFVANSLPASESWQQELSTAALGAYLAEVAAHIWCRPPFRNGEVPMDAQHIQLADGLAR
jgi:hypothetical protein